MQNRENASFIFFKKFALDRWLNPMGSGKMRKTIVSRTEKGQKLRKFCLHLKEDSAIIYSILCPGGRKLSNYGGNPGYKSNYRGRFSTRPVKI